MTPTGIKSFGHKSKDDSGKFHPDDITSGLETVDKKGGSGPKEMKTGKGSNSPPKGVVRGDGTESLKGIKVVHKQGSIAKAPGSGSQHIPGEVRKNSGLKAPNSGKQP